jgi:hypothetical protein
MTEEELIKHWIALSDDNFNSMQNMFKAKEYMWTTKGIFIKNVQGILHPKILNV